MALTDLVTPVPKRQTLGADVHAQIRELLTSGRLRPGEQISLRTTAQALGVSVMPVREAVYQLVAEQALEVTANRSIRVPRMTVSAFREMTYIRVHVESLAAHHATQHCTKALIREMRGWNEKLEVEMRTAEPDAAKLILFNRELHFAMYRAAEMPLLFKMIESLWLRVGPILNYDLRSGSPRVKERTAVTHHKRMIAALDKGDTVGAGEALRDDIQSAANTIIAAGVLLDADDAGDEG